MRRLSIAFALVALVHADDDPYTSTLTDVRQLSLTERRLALRVFQVQGV